MTDVIVTAYDHLQRSFSLNRMRIYHFSSTNMGRGIQMHTTSILPEDASLLIQHLS